MVEQQPTRAAISRSFAGHDRNCVYIWDRTDPEDCDCARDVLLLDDDGEVLNLLDDDGYEWSQ